MKPWGVGVIGCGSISGNHFHGIKKLDTVQLRAVCDIDPEKLGKAKMEQNADEYLDWRELIKRPDIDAVHICTPHYLHAEMSIAALNAGKHVICEKPMGVSAAEAEAMCRASRDNGKALTVCFQNRYNGASKRMKALIDSGMLGKVQGGCAFVTWDRDESYYASGNWRGKWDTEGGSVLINQAVHTLDLMRWLAGGFEMTGSSMSAKRLANCIETEDTCDLLLTNAAGARFLFYATVCGPDNLPVQIHLLFEKGELHLDGSRLSVITEDYTALEDYATTLTVGKDYWGSSHERLIADFYARLQGGQPPFITPEDAMQTTLLLDRAYTSAAATRIRP